MPQIMLLSMGNVKDWRFFGMKEHIEQRIRHIAEHLMRLEYDAKLIKQKRAKRH